MQSYLILQSRGDSACHAHKVRSVRSCLQGREKHVYRWEFSDTCAFVPWYILGWWECHTSLMLTPGSCHWMLPKAKSRGEFGGTVSSKRLEQFSEKERRVLILIFFNKNFFKKIIGVGGNQTIPIPASHSKYRYILSHFLQIIWKKFAFKFHMLFVHSSLLKYEIWLAIGSLWYKCYLYFQMVSSWLITRCLSSGSEGATF